jgi:hypothetical protein
MSDIVDRLEVQAEHGLFDLPEGHEVVGWQIAADEITRLTAEDERLRKAIKRIHDTLCKTRTMPTYSVGYEIEWCIDHARAAFKGDSDGT